MGKPFISVWRYCAGCSVCGHFGIHCRFVVLFGTHHHCALCCIGENIFRETLHWGHNGRGNSGDRDRILYELVSGQSHVEIGQLYMMKGLHYISISHSADSAPFFCFKLILIWHTVCFPPLPVCTVCTPDRYRGSERGTFESQSRPFTSCWLFIEFQY